MNAHSHAKLTPLSRAELVKRVVELGQPVAEVAAGFGLSVRSAQKWLARFRAEGAAGLQNRSSRPKRSPDGIHRLRVLRVLALRRRKLPGFQIARLARLSKASVSRIRRRHAAFLAELSPPPPIRRSEREQPGDLLHFDIKRLARFDRPGHRVTGDRREGSSPGAGWEFLHVAIDDHSRVAFARILPDETAACAVSFLHASLEFFQKLGVQTKRVYSDNGSCYRAQAMASTVATLGLKQRFTRPYTPQTNGKAERFIQTSLRSWAYAHAYRDSSQRADRLPAFLHNYNWHRPHHSLNLKPPVARLRLHLNNLLSLHN